MRVAILGGGTMGLAAADAAARAGMEVELFEARTHVHDEGSHGGYTRVFRHAYHEGSHYVGLIQEADRAWVELEGWRGEELLVRSGLLEFGPPEDPDFRAANAALEAHGLAHDFLDSQELRDFGVQTPADWRGCLSHDAGFLRVPACLGALRARAEEAGARLHFEHPVRVDLEGRRPRLQDRAGGFVDADRILVCAGAYAPGLLPSFFGEATQGSSHPARKLGYARRRVLAWAQPRGAAPDQKLSGALARLPVWAGFCPEGFVYGFPYRGFDAGGSPLDGVAGLKLAVHELTCGSSEAARTDAAKLDQKVDPDRVDREVHEEDLRVLRSFLQRYLPEAQGPIVHSKVCLYGDSPTGDFLIDHHPEFPELWVAAGFSGHGFKFAPAIGSLLTELMTGTSDRRLHGFRREEQLRAAARL